MKLISLKTVTLTGTAILLTAGATLCGAAETGTPATPSSAAAASPAPAAVPGHRPKGNRAGKHAKGEIADQLNLNDAQKQQIQAVIKQNAPTIRPMMDQLVTERKALRDLIQATPVNEAAIRAQSAKVDGIETELAVKRAHVSEQIQAILTPDQVAKAKELRAQNEDRMERVMQRFQKKMDTSAGA